MAEPTPLPSASREVIEAAEAAVAPHHHVELEEMIAHLTVTHGCQFGMQWIEATLGAAFGQAERSAIVRPDGSKQIELDQAAVINTPGNLEVIAKLHAEHHELDIDHGKGLITHEHGS